MRIRALVCVVVVSLSALLSSQNQQSVRQLPFTDLERGRALQMMDTISSDVKKHYYDPHFHGVDWDMRVAEAKDRIKKSTSQNAVLSHIAGALDSLHDSHTFFLPPSRPYVHDYGVQFQMVGDKCFVTRVRPGSDAETKGIKPGDQLLAINGFEPTRDNLWQMEYVFHTLRTQLSLKLDVRSPAGNQRQVEAAAKFRELRRMKDLTAAGGGGDMWDLYRDEEDYYHLNRARTAEFGDNLMILKFPVFNFNQSEVEGMISKARKHKALIIDLRENGGGAIETLKFLLSDTLKEDTKVADRVTRKDSKPLIEKFHVHNPYDGKLVVLVDSGSASASEIFARVIQLERRGTVIGDRSSGKVMESLHYNYRAGMGVTVFYGASITEADVLMSDGKSLENVGVAPDEVFLPTGADLASGWDPVLAHAGRSA
jgi:carboxyl-terminal processing protease